MNAKYLEWLSRNTAPTCRFSGRRLRAGIFQGRDDRKAFPIERFPTYRESVIAACKGLPRCEHQLVTLQPDDTAMCPECGLWFHMNAEGNVYNIHDSEAARNADAPMGPDECMAALDAAGERLQTEV